ncbi:hypothetical protein E2C01_095699 [Portunus trituberculatus]|uniref:Uncharacterized protein n=1 Tax=Portunus trituberculatus TaxID=210409 RepID=A0A5B7K4W9_PORTR|nr:hypothetical protein [Portunus trituberculatus]
MPAVFFSQHLPDGARAPRPGVTPKASSLLPSPRYHGGEAAPVTLVSGTLACVLVYSGLVRNAFKR